MSSSATTIATGSDYNKFAVFCIFLVPALGGLLFGYDIGATSFVSEQLQSSNKAGVDWYIHGDNVSVLTGLVTGMGVGGALIGTLLAFKIGDILGKT